MVQNDTFRGIVSGVIRGARTVRINPTGSDTYETVLEIDQDVAGSNGLNIDTETTTAKGISVAADALTSGNIAYFYSKAYPCLAKERDRRCGSLHL